MDAPLTPADVYGAALHTVPGFSMDADDQLSSGHGAFEQFLKTRDECYLANMRPVQIVALLALDVGPRIVIGDSLLRRASNLLDALGSRERLAKSVLRRRLGEVDGLRSEIDAFVTTEHQPGPPQFDVHIGGRDAPPFAAPADRPPTELEIGHYAFEAFLLDGDLVHLTSLPGDPFREAIRWDIGPRIASADVLLRHAAPLISLLRMAVGQPASHETTVRDREARRLVTVIHRYLVDAHAGRLVGREDEITTQVLAEHLTTENERRQEEARRQRRSSRPSPSRDLFFPPRSLR